MGACTHGNFDSLWPQAHAAFQREGLAVEVLEVRIGKVYADSADLRFRIAEMPRRWRFYIGLKGVGIGLFRSFPADSSKPEGRSHLH